MHTKYIHMMWTRNICLASWKSNLNWIYSCDHTLVSCLFIHFKNKWRQRILELRSILFCSAEKTSFDVYYASLFCSHNFVFSLLKQNIAIGTFQWAFNIVKKVKSVKRMSPSVNNSPLKKLIWFQLVICKWYTGNDK